ncbi:MAG: class I SAM-dependent methyltransferase [Prevotellaceae bacterium]|jgi:SAM-dependent methyltransferase|nr:class I SAM-dependent methyltransferase [Prevotellaceae bacterium]
MEYENNPASIKFYVKKYINSHQATIKDKIVVDFPAGTGTTSRLIQSVGGNVKPFDLFPEYFAAANITCQKADINEGIPLDDKSADMLICQEGIEHFADQIKALKEFNRVLKPNGLLLITTPNYSNIRAKMSYLFSESERFNSIMPPNEVDSIWLSKDTSNDEIYYGHIFLIGIQKLRLLAKLAGFRMTAIYKNRLKTTSLFLFPFIYPAMALSNYITYAKAKKRAKGNDHARRVYRELLALSINPTILLHGHLMVEFEKEADAKEVKATLVDKSDSVLSYFSASAKKAVYLQRNLSILIQPIKF